MKIIKKLIIVIIVLLVQLCFTRYYSFGQGEANVWYTGGGAAASCGLDFNTTPPTLLENGANLMPSATGEGAGAICDAAGVLQFYTNGESIFRANHTAMPSSSGAALPTLNGNPTTTQTGLCIPINGFPGRYFVVSTSNGGDVKYVIVNMTLFGGLGAVTTASLAGGNGTLLRTGPLGEGAIIIPEFSGTNVATGENWVIIHGMSDNNYYVYKTSGLAINYVATYAVGFTPPGQAVMIFKTNSCFDKIGVTFYNAGRVEVLPFNNITGVISAPTLILDSKSTGAHVSGAPFLNVEVYGIEFSPSGRYLYVSESGLNSRRTIYQFDISLGTGLNPAAVMASKSFRTMNDESGGPDNDRAGALQLGPDGKIYVPLFSNAPPSYLNVIPTPDVAWSIPTPTATQYEYLKYTYNTTRVGEGLPPILRSLLTQVRIIYTNACAGNTTSFSYIFGGSAVTTTWDFGDPTSGAANTSTLPTPTHVYNTGGTYTVTLTIVDNCGRSHIGTVNVIVKPGPEVTVPTACAPQTVTLTGTGTNAANYTWSLNSDMSSPTGPSSTYNYTAGTLPRTVYVRDPTPLSTNTVGNTSAGDNFGADVGHTYFELFTTVNIVSFTVTSRENNTTSANFYIQNEAGSTTYWGPYNYVSNLNVTNIIPVNITLGPGRYRFFTSRVDKCYRNNTDDDGGRDVTGVIDVLGEKSGTKGGSFFNIVVSIPDPCGIRSYVITENCAAPITLLRFYGEKIGQEIALHWDVTHEINNAYFIVERSTNGIDFTTIGQVKGNGNSDALSSYQFLDGKPVVGKNYYRIIQVDVDGTLHYSTIIMINVSEFSISVAPNPFHDHTMVWISADEAMMVEVIDMLGRVVSTVSKLEHENSVEVGENLESGTYVLRVLNQNNVYTFKIAKD